VPKPKIAPPFLLRSVCRVTLAQKLAQLVEDLAVIDDAHERLSVVIDRAKSRPPLPAAARDEAHRIRGCISAAWLVGEVHAGCCSFRTDADSPLVRGLLALLADFFSGAPAAEIAACELDPIEALGLARNLSPTRVNGLRSARASIREFAQQHAQ
jgi:cysteine desulfuration protein SufE